MIWPLIYPTHVQTAKWKNGIVSWTKFDLMNTPIPLGVLAPSIAQLRNYFCCSHLNPVPATLKVQRKAHQLLDFVPKGSSPRMSLASPLLFSSPDSNILGGQLMAPCWKQWFPNRMLQGASRVTKGRWARQRHSWARGLATFPWSAHLPLSHVEFLHKLWGRFCCFKRL